MRTIFLAALFVVGGELLIGCDSGDLGATAFPVTRSPDATLVGPAAEQTPWFFPGQPHASGWLLPQARFARGLVYATNNDEVAIFPEKGTNPAQIGAITKGISAAWGLFVDRRLRLYACNRNRGTVTVYERGKLAPQKTFLTGLSGPLYATVDSHDNLFVSNAGNGTVTEFVGSRPNDTRSIPTPGYEADGLAVDDKDNLYVAYRAASASGIEFYRAGHKVGIDLGISINSPQGLLIDQSGDIVVVDTKYYVVDIFPPGQTSPTKQIGIFDPYELAFDQADSSLFVSSADPNGIFVFAYPDGTPTLNYGSSLNYVVGLAVSPAGRTGPPWRR